jgi:DNA-binding transcriptional LysR family regulator
MNDQITGIRLFIRVARSGSVSRAAEQLGISQPTASRLLSALERELGVSLLARSTRALSLTQGGAEYLSRVEPLIAALEEANQAARQSKSELRGALRIGLPVSIAIREVIPRLPAFLNKHPQLKVELVTNDSHQHLVRDGIDVAICMGELADSPATYRKIGSNRRLLVASPKYLSKSGNPRTPAELSRHAVVAGPAAQRECAWKFTRAEKKAAVRVQTVITSNVNEAAVAAAVNGLGIALCGVWGCRSELESGLLSIVLKDWDMGAVPVYVLYPAGRATKSAARLFVDHLAGDLKSTVLVDGPPLPPD